MLLAALYQLVLQMRQSFADFPGVPRTQAQILGVGLRRADTMYPALAANIRADDVGCQTILNVAAKAIVESTSFTAAWTSNKPKQYDLSASMLGFFDGAMAAPVIPA